MVDILLDITEIPLDLLEFFEPVEPAFARDVLRISTTPYSGAHFATFPPALVEPCILAGTSAAGQCPHCGAPWERVVEKKRMKRTELSPDDKRYRPNTYNGAYGDINGKSDAGYTETKTIGWRPTCACPAHEPIPQLVLDPFGGAGTTALVALRHGRRAVLLDLNAAYLVLARERLAPLLAQPRLFKTAILGNSQEVQ